MVACSGSPTSLTNCNLLYFGYQVSGYAFNNIAILYAHTSGKETGGGGQIYDNFNELIF